MQPISMGSNESNDQRGSLCPGMNLSNSESTRGLPTLDWEGKADVIEKTPSG
jgi:hypothetical protein